MQLQSKHKLFISIVILLWYLYINPSHLQALCIVIKRMACVKMKPLSQLKNWLEFNENKSYYLIFIAEFLRI